MSLAELLDKGRPVQRSFRITVLSNADLDDREVLEGLYAGEVDVDRISALARGEVIDDPEPEQEDGEELESLDMSMVTA
jgi:hypothetical protein